jgi:hypothetical protein
MKAPNPNHPNSKPPHPIPLPRETVSQYEKKGFVEKGERRLGGKGLER